MRWKNKKKFDYCILFYLLIYNIFTMNKIPWEEKTTSVYFFYKNSSLFLGEW